MAGEKYVYIVIIIIKSLCWNSVAVIGQLAVNEAAHKAGATAEVTASRKAKCVSEQIAPWRRWGVFKLSSRLYS